MLCGFPPRNPRAPLGGALGEISLGPCAPGVPSQAWIPGSWLRPSGCVRAVGLAGSARTLGPPRRCAGQFSAFAPGARCVLSEASVLRLLYPPSFGPLSWCWWSRCSSSAPAPGRGALGLLTPLALGGVLCNFRFPRSSSWEPSAHLTGCRSVFGGAPRARVRFVRRRGSLIAGPLFPAHARSLWAVLGLRRPCMASHPWRIDRIFT